MYQTEEVLFVELVQVAVVVLQQQVFGDFVIGASVDELVAVGSASARATNRHLFVVAGVTAFNVLDLTTDQGQVLELVGGDLATFKGLRQQTTIVVGDDRQFRHQGAVTQFGLGNLGFGGQAQAGKFIHSIAVGLAREHGAAVGIAATAVGTTARIQTHAQQPDGINTEAHGALGETRGVVQLEALAPLFVFALCIGCSTSRRIAVVVIDVEVTQFQRGFAVFDKTGSARLLCQQTYGHSHGQGGLVHCLAPLHF